MHVYYALIADNSVCIREVSICAALHVVVIWSDIMGGVQSWSNALSCHKSS